MGHHLPHTNPSTFSFIASGLFCLADHPLLIWKTHGRMFKGPWLESDEPEPPPSVKCCYCCSVAKACPTLETPWNAACQASLSSVSRSLLKRVSIESVMLSNHLILCCPFSSCPQSCPASRSFPVSLLFTSGGPSIGASALASVLPMNIQGWFPFKIDWFDLLAVQGTVNSLPQHHSLKASVLQCSAFFMVQLSHLWGSSENSDRLYFGGLQNHCKWWLQPWN